MGTVQGIPFGLGPEMELPRMSFERHYSEPTNVSKRLLEIPVLIQKECPALAGIFNYKGLITT